MKAMFGFFSSDHSSAIVVDVGSSSVGVAIVCIHLDGTPENIWEHREYCLIRDNPDTKTHLKQIKTALTNAFLELGHVGLKALRESGHNTNIVEIQAIFAAPWSYTITKTISLKDEHPFEVTDELIGELVESAKKQGKLMLGTNQIANALGLEITYGDVISIVINDYSVIEPIGQEGRSVALSYVETAISKEVSNTLAEVVDKFFPKATLTQYSFMYAFYLTMRNLRPNTSEICLIDVTGEATEIGIVRDDVLRHTTYTSDGTYTIARDIAQAANVPKEEAYSYMKEGFEDLLERLPKRFQDSVVSVVEHYSDSVSAMFMRTGDALSIPKTIFMHTDARTENFFVRQLERATQKATGKEHTIHPVTAKVLGTPVKQDTALLVAMNFLVHKEQYMRLLPKAD